MTINIIDPHIHLFDLSQGDYHWLKSQNPPSWPDKVIIGRNFDLDDLTNSLAINLTNDGDYNDELIVEVNLSGFVHIEAGFDNEKPWRELEYLDSSLHEKLVHKQCRTIANLDLLSSTKEFKFTLKKLQYHHSLVGVRHILDEDAFDILSNPQVQQNLSFLDEIKGFIFELQLPLADKITTSAIPILTETIAQNSQLRFIINHSGFPPKKRLTDRDSMPWSLWQKNILELAQYSNVFIKCSGMEMIERQYDMLWFSKVVRFCIHAFSIERVMLASNFPLCLFSKKSYRHYWLDVLQSSVIKQCCKKEKSALLYNNALKIYHINTKL
jgi:predicted TIM-barrel fold metal-dependent hydrolase